MSESIDPIPEPAPSEFQPSDLRHDRNWANSKFGAAVAGVLAASEVFPVNVAVFGATQAAFGDPAITAAVFAGATSATKVAGTTAAADLLDTRMGSRQAVWFNKKLINRLGPAKNLRTNVEIDFAIGMTAGTVAMLALKQIQDPERARSVNRRYGLINAIGVSAVFSAIGWLGAEGISHPNPEDIAGTVFGVGLIVGLGKWAKKRMVRNRTEEADNAI